MRISSSASREQVSFTSGVESLGRESNGLDVVVELEGSVDLDQADVVDDDAGVVVLNRHKFD